MEEKGHMQILNGGNTDHSKYSKSVIYTLQKFLSLNIHPQKFASQKLEYHNELLDGKIWAT